MKELLLSIFAKYRYLMYMNYLFKLSFVSLLLCLASCVTTDNKANFDRIGPIEQARDAISRTPTRFDISSDDEVVAWNRTRTFFATSLSNEGVKVEKIGAEDLRISNRESKKERFFYSVIKRRKGKGTYSFEVLVSPRVVGLEDDAQLNARNLARFIREGELQTMLLKR